MLIEQELGADPKEVALDKESIRAWDPPYDNEVVGGPEKDQIVANMAEAFARRGYRLVFFASRPVT